MWGLLSLLPQAVAYHYRGSEYHSILYLFGLLGFPFALAFASARVTNSLKMGATLFAYLIPVIMFIISPLSMIFVLDPRVNLPTRWLIPVMYVIRQPSRSNSHFSAVACPVIYCVFCGILVRATIGTTANVGRHFFALVLAGITLALLLTTHFWLARVFSWSNDPFGIGLIASFYILLLAFGLFFVALFYDYNATTTSSPPPKTPEPL